MACVTLVVEVRKQYVISETDNNLQGSLLLEIARVVQLRLAVVVFLPQGENGHKLMSRC